MRIKTTLIAAASTLLLVTQAVWADRLIVIKSDVPDYRAQSVIEASVTLRIPPGKSLTVMLPDGTMRQLTSVDNKPVHEILAPVKPAPWYQKLLEALRRAGGSTTTGGTRGFKPSTGSATVSVDGQREGLVCTSGDVGPPLSRDPLRATDALMVALEFDGKYVDASFAPGAVSRLWPKDVPLSGKVRVRAANQAPFEIEMTRIDAAAGPARVAALAAAGCTGQATAALRALGQ